jgi:hypothetical protein
VGWLEEKVGGWHLGSWKGNGGIGIFLVWLDRNGEEEKGRVPFPFGNLGR